MHTTGFNPINYTIQSRTIEGEVYDVMTCHLVYYVPCINNFYGMCGPIFQYEYQKHRTRLSRLTYQTQLTHLVIILSSSNDRMQ